MGEFYFVSINDQFCEIPSQIVLPGVLIECFWIISIPFICIIIAIYKTFKHPPIASGIPDSFSIVCINRTGHILTEGLTFRRSLFSIRELTCGRTRSEISAIKQEMLILKNCAVFYEFLIRIYVDYFSQCRVKPYLCLFILSLRD